MTKTQFLITLTTGLAAAALHASIFVGSSLSLLLFYMAPLPLFVAVLSAGLVSGLAASGFAALLLLIGLGVKPALFFLGVAALAPMILGRLALLNRPVNGVASEGEAVRDGIAWYPEGRLVLWAAIMAGLLLTVVIIMAGPDAESFRAATRAAASDVMGPALEALAEDQREEFLSWVVSMVPLASAAAWLLAIVLNLRLAILILARSSQNLRPWTDFGAMQFPQQSVFLLGAALAGALLPGTAGLLAEVFAAALLTAYTLLGLAVVHGLLKANRGRGPLLAALYAALMILNAVVAVPLALLGIADSSFRLRQRLAGGSDHTNHPST